MFYDKIVVDGIEFFSTKCDIYGNPRYIVHCNSLAATYSEAVAVAKQLGYKKYRGKYFGGGFVFSSYNLVEDAARIRAAYPRES